MGSQYVLARTAGAVVHRRGSKGVEFLLVHRPRYDDWSLPKGHLDDGETYEEAAVREVEEESGFTGSLGPQVGTVGYRTRLKQKVVRYWLLGVDGGKFKPNKEADAIRWLSPRKARRLTSYTRDANLMAHAERIIANPKAAVLHLVRHADAGQRSAWDQADWKRPLSRKGIRQSEMITARLLKQPITTVHSSRYVRCDETVRALADKLDLELSHHKALAEGADPDKTIALIKRLRGEAAVMCSHGDVISGLISRLADEGVDVGPEPAWRKASTWTLDLVKGRAVAGTYVPPPPISRS